MPRQNTQLNFGTDREPAEPFLLHDKIIKDRGSVYSVSIGRVCGRDDIRAFLKTLKQHKGYHSATHHSWAARVRKDEAIYETKADDGEVGAGMVILRELQRAEVVNVVVCVTRWFGGTKLMNDRYVHIQTAVQYATKHL